MLCAFGHKICGYTKTTISTEFHRNTGKKHGTCCWCRRVTIGHPGMKRKQCSKNSKANKKQGKIDQLVIKWNILLAISNMLNVLDSAGMAK